MNQTVLILIIAAVFLLFGLNIYLKHARSVSNSEDRRKDESQARSVAGADWATKVDRPEWADRGNAQVKKQSLPNGNTLGSSSGSFSFDATKNEKSNPVE